MALFGRRSTGPILAISTLLATIFVAIQAWYARISYVEADATRFLERKLDICFENFDTAARLDGMLRTTVPGMMDQDVWPPKVEINSARALADIQTKVVPLLDELTAGFTKASVLEGLDKHRVFLTQRVTGLSKQLLDLRPENLEPDNEQTNLILAKLSDFLGAQYSVFTGCRMIARGEI